METKKTGFRCVNSFHLKLIALITMTIDHIAAILGCGNLYMPMRCIGRIAFPIYCFLLVQGFLHTRSKRNYLLELLVVFLISEPIYDFAFRGVWFYWFNQNVMLELVLGLATLWLMEAVPELCRKIVPNAKPDGAPLLFCIYFFQAATVLIGCVLADTLFYADYGSGGILLIVALYLFREKPIPLCLSVAAIMCLCISIMEIFGLLSLIPILLYNGERGTALTGKRAKYFFYLYYPAHITVIGLLSLVLH